MRPCSPLRPAALLLALLASSAGLPGCGGGGGRGPTAPAPPPEPVESISFTPAGAPAGAAVRIPAADASGATALELEIRAEDVTDLYGVSFDLDFPEGFARWDEAGTIPGDFLGDTELLIAEDPPGTLIVGLTRLGDQDGVSGSGLLVTLRFVAEADGNGAITFRQEAAFDSEGAPIQGLEWLGGTLEADI